MKKTYINPTTDVVEIKTSNLIAASPELSGTYGGGAILSRESDEDDLLDLINQ